MVNQKKLIRELNTYVNKYGVAVLSLSNGKPVAEDGSESLSMWSLSDTLIGTQKGQVPSKDLRTQLWEKRDSKWLKQGIGVLWAVEHPEMERICCGIAILVSEDKAQRLIDAGSERVFIQGAVEAEVAEVV